MSKLQDIYNFIFENEITLLYKFNENKKNLTIITKNTNTIYKITELNITNIKATNFICNLINYEFILNVNINYKNYDFSLKKILNILFPPDPRTLCKNDTSLISGDLLIDIDINKFIKLNDYGYDCDELMEYLISVNLKNVNPYNKFIKIYNNTSELNKLLTHKYLNALLLQKYNTMIELIDIQKKLIPLKLIKNLKSTNLGVNIYFDDIFNTIGDYGFKMLNDNIDSFSNDSNIFIKSIKLIENLREIIKTCQLIEENPQKNSEVELTQNGDFKNASRPCVENTFKNESRGEAELTPNKGFKNATQNSVNNNNSDFYNELYYYDINIKDLLDSAHTTCIHQVGYNLMKIYMYWMGETINYLYNPQKINSQDTINEKYKNILNLLDYNNYYNLYINENYIRYDNFIISCGYLDDRLMIKSYDIYNKTFDNIEIYNYTNVISCKNVVLKNFLLKHKSNLFDKYIKNKDIILYFSNYKLFIEGNNYDFDIAIFKLITKNNYDYNNSYNLSIVLNYNYNILNIICTHNNNKIFEIS